MGPWELLNLRTISDAILRGVQMTPVMMKILVDREINTEILGLTSIATNPLHLDHLGQTGKLHHLPWVGNADQALTLTVAAHIEAQTVILDRVCHHHIESQELLVLHLGIQKAQAHVVTPCMINAEFLHGVEWPQHGLGGVADSFVLY